MSFKPNGAPGWSNGAPGWPNGAPGCPNGEPGGAKGEQSDSLGGAHPRDMLPRKHISGTCPAMK